MAGHINKKTFLGSLAGGLMLVFGKSRIKVTPEDLKRADFKTSTQQFGLRFTERIRRVFRFKWLSLRSGATESKGTK